VVERLPRKRKVLDSVLSSEKKKKKERKKERKEGRKEERNIVLFYFALLKS